MWIFTTVWITGNLSPPMSVASCWIWWCSCICCQLERGDIRCEKYSAWLYNSKISNHFTEPVCKHFAFFIMSVYQDNTFAHTKVVFFIFKIILWSFLTEAILKTDPMPCQVFSFHFNQSLLCCSFMLLYCRKSVLQTFWPSGTKNQKNRMKELIYPQIVFNN